MPLNRINHLPSGRLKGFLLHGEKLCPSLILCTLSGASHRAAGSAGALQHAWGKRVLRI